MRLNRSQLLLGVIIGACLIIQLLALTTQYTPRFDGSQCPKDDVVDCGASRHVIVTLFGDIELEDGWMNSKEQNVFNSVRLAALLIPLVFEIAAVATLIQLHQKK